MHQCKCIIQVYRQVTHSQHTAVVRSMKYSFLHSHRLSHFLLSHIPSPYFLSFSLNSTNLIWKNRLTLTNRSLCNSSGAGLWTALGLLKANCERNFERHNFISFVLSVFLIVSVKHHLTGWVQDGRHAEPPTEIYFCSHRLFASTITHTLSTPPQILESLWAFCSGDRIAVRIWPGVSSWSEKIQPFSHPGKAQNLWLVFPNLTNKGEWKQTFLQSTQDRV